MKDFLYIKKLYHSEADRTVEDLKKKYDNYQDLKSCINELVYPELITTGLLKGKKVLLKPNLVLHNRKEDDEICLRTDYNVLLSLLEIVLEQNPASVIIGDAPIQGCNWDLVIKESFLSQVNELSRRFEISVKVKDFRRVTFSPDKNNPVRERNPLSDYIIFDVGKKSYLEPITDPAKSVFRVTNYDPDRLAESHGPGVHKYCITKEVFESDVVISIPKLKTHQKTGITAALKNIVGINGDKDYLPHHRLGGTGFGGDCYPGKNILRLWAEKLLDQANRNQGKLQYWLWAKLSAGLWKLSKPRKVHQIAAAWHGNDTTWRMVMDLNQIVLFGKADGTLSDIQQRKLYSLGDGIIGGQGDGPLKPMPLPLGVMTFTDNSALHDVALCKMMGFSEQKIPLINEAGQWIQNKEINVFLNDKKIELSELSEYKIQTTPPPGWVEHLIERI